ncbi:hypothetical protein AVEN_50055-1 [Araneus ventricosus]|uniref:Uncharacterized protein n=1 Tax=Araneus ventricosus TaxID=182803 RepID=A0A4Y2GBV2_ARAVE|nr:hypothetical protein AVEN_50055-1 [Araneus ventricosus]
MQLTGYFSQTRFGASDLKFVFGVQDSNPKPFRIQHKGSMERGGRNASFEPTYKGQALLEAKEKHYFRFNRKLGLQDRKSSSSNHPLKNRCPASEGSSPESTVHLHFFGKDVPIVLLHCRKKVKIGGEGSQADHKLSRMAISLEGVCSSKSLR